MSLELALVQHETLAQGVSIGVPHIIARSIGSQAQAPQDAAADAARLGRALTRACQEAGLWVALEAGLHLVGWGREEAAPVPLVNEGLLQEWLKISTPGRIRLR